MLHGADQRVLAALERRAAVGERHLVDDGLGAALVDDEHRLDPDLAGGVVEPPRPQLAQHAARGPWRHTSAGAPSTPASSSSLVGTSVASWISAMRRTRHQPQPEEVARAEGQGDGAVVGDLREALAAEEVLELRALELLGHPDRRGLRAARRGC